MPLGRSNGEDGACNGCKNYHPVDLHRALFLLVNGKALTSFMPQNLQHTVDTKLLWKVRQHWLGDKLGRIYTGVNEVPKPGSSCGRILDFYRARAFPQSQGVWL